MRTHQSNTRKKLSKSTKKRILYSVLFTAAILAVAAIITLSVTLGNNPPTENNPYDPPIEAPPPPPPPPPPPLLPSFVLPMENFTLGTLATLDKPVYNSSMNQWRTHNGVDFLAPRGSNVMAVSAGTVISVEHTQLEATVVRIQHANNLISTYKGLDTDVLVETGDAVKEGDRIGALASHMPRYRADGPKLHLQMTHNGTLIDPLQRLPNINK